MVLSHALHSQILGYVAMSTYKTKSSKLKLMGFSKLHSKSKIGVI